MKKITVLIVDDSSVIRSIVREVLSTADDIEVIGEAKDPFVARELIKKLNPDVLTLDVEMPKMDGITFLNNLMRLRPMPVVMLSTLTTKGADITLEALELGAIDFVAKPSFEELIVDKESFANRLIDKVRSAAKVDQKNSKLSVSLSSHDKKKALSFSGSKRPNNLVVIGASTGGVDAIRTIVAQLPENAPPIVITVHIPETFSDRFAKRMNKHCAMNIQEAQHGQKIKPGNVYIAPGGKHLKVEQKGASLFCTLEMSEPVNRHMPAVDVLFESVMPMASNIHAFLLTGMGNDGAEGLRALKEEGAMTVIQDKATSVIWGMPGIAHSMNAHVKQCALPDIASEILRYASLNNNEIREELYERS